MLEPASQDANHEKHLLYGTNFETRIVAVEMTRDSSIRIYKRIDGSVSYYDDFFHPFFLLSDLSLLDRFSKDYGREDLSGSHYYKHLVKFRTWKEHWFAVKHVTQAYSRLKGKNVESYRNVTPLLVIPNPQAQYMAYTGKTLFKGMDFNDLYRMQLDIEVYSEHGFPDAERPEDRIIIIALSDNKGWEHAIEARKSDEKAMLEELCRTIWEKDPDVIEGHNIFNFDLDYILKRCALHDVIFLAGRDDSPPRTFATRGKVGDAQVEYSACYFHGRHVIDTFFMLQQYDTKKRELEEYKLKYAASFLGLAKDKRAVVDAGNMKWCWENQPEQTIRYSLDDVYDVKMLSEYLCRNTGIFYQCQMLPVSFQTLALMGDGSKIQSLMMRAYFANRHSLPKPQTKLTYEGARKEVFRTGLGKPVIHADVTSLYPSIMLNHSIKPATDDLGIFLTLLSSLKKIRLNAKAEMRQAKDDSERAKLEALQLTYKVLINSFYGYLGYSLGLFNDMSQAAKVTETGRDLLTQMIKLITETGGTVLEADTDGIYFVPPKDFSAAEQHERFVAIISDMMPEGIDIEYDGTYPRMLSYKKANYVLQKPDGSLVIKGASFRSRAVEKFTRQFIREAVESFLSEDLNGFLNLYGTYKNKLINRELDITDISKKERLRQTLEEYEEKTKDGGPRLAAYQIALRSSGRCRKGDQIEYYITGNKKTVRNWEAAKPVEEWKPDARDENVKYYLKRLDLAANRFENFSKGLDIYTPGEPAITITPSIVKLFALLPPRKRARPERLHSRQVEQFFTRVKEDISGVKNEETEPQ